jgi:phosphatidylglycerol:prolipoprotein diacylglycerol transferase
MNPLSAAYPFIDPVIIEIGPLTIRWYGMMYLLGFVAGYFVIRSELKRRGGPVSVDQAEDMLFYIIVGLLVGARLGYILIYNLPLYASSPLQALAFWKGGMSFHGGLVGVIIAGYIFARKNRAQFLELADIGALAAPIGLMLGRIGNFINGELYGRVTDLPWGVIFPAGGPEARHPSQLYESALEGPILFIILWRLRKRTTRNGQVLAAFLIGYGIIRFMIEFVRAPDPQIGFILNYFTMGQILCLVMILTGAFLLVHVSVDKGSERVDQNGIT